MTKKPMIFLSLLFSLIVHASPAQYRPIHGSTDDSVYRAKMKTFISDWWDSPYKWGGTSKRGVDCSAFTQKLFRVVYELSLIHI